MNMKESTPVQQRINISSKLMDMNDSMDRLNERLGKLADAVRGVQPSNCGDLVKEPKCLQDAVDVITSKTNASHIMVASIEAAIGL